MMARGYGDNDIHLMRAIATCNPKLANARGMATKYIKEPEDMKSLGDGVWALRRHGGTIVVIYGVKRRDLQENGGSAGRSGNICTGYDPP
jgi:hypothetical protein